ncbi:MAG: hypothetical protein ABSA02_31925 [Trebonia sp.]
MTPSTSGASDGGTDTSRSLDSITAGFPFAPVTRYRSIRTPNADCIFDTGPVADT